MKAVILAGGEGTRLAPLTNVRPKPMLPVGNKPILEHVIEAVRAAGIEEIVLVVGYKRQRIQNYFGDGDDWGVELEYVVQETQLGSGHALLQAESVIGRDFIVLNGDQIVASAAIERVMAERTRTANPVMAVSRSAETQLYGVVDVEDGIAVELIEKPGAAELDSELVNVGVYAFGPDIFPALRETESDGELGLTTALRHHLSDHPVHTVAYEGSWFDVTRPWDLLTVNGYLLDAESEPTVQDGAIHASATVVDGTLVGENTAVRPNATVLRRTSLGENVTIGANTVVENAIVMADATIGPSATIRDCIVGANATIGAGTVAEGGQTDIILDGSIHHDVRFGGILGDNAAVGGNVTVTPGTRLGNQCRVDSRCVLEGWYEPGSEIRRG